MAQPPFSGNVDTALIYGIVVTGQSLIVHLRMDNSTATYAKSVVLKVCGAKLPNELTDTITMHLMDLKYDEAHRILQKPQYSDDWSAAVAKFEAPEMMRRRAKQGHPSESKDPLLFRILGLDFENPPNYHPIDRPVGFVAMRDPACRITYAGRAKGVASAIHVAHGLPLPASIGWWKRFRLCPKVTFLSTTRALTYINVQQYFHADVHGVQEAMENWDADLVRRAVEEARFEVVASSAGADPWAPTLRLIICFHADPEPQSVPSIQAIARARLTATLRKWADKIRTAL